MILGAGWVQQRREDADNQTAPIGGISGYVDINPSVRLKAGLSRKVKAPTLAQLYDSTRGNTALKMEEATTTEFGTVWKVDQNTVVDATLFRSAVKNFIQPNAAGQQENLARYRNTGLELLARSTWANLDYGIGYTYMMGKDLSANTDSNNLQYNPRQKITLDTLWRVTSLAALSTSAVHIRDQQYYSRQAPILSATLPAYTVINTKFSYTLAGTATQLYAGIDNLFDKLYSTSYSFPQAGRYFYAGVKFGF